MATHFAAFEAFGRRHSAGPIYSGEFSKRFSSALGETNPAGTDYVPYLLDQRPGAGYLVEATGYVETTDGTRAAVGTISGVDGWWIDGTYLDNGGIQSIQENTAAVGRNTPQYRFAFAGAARTAVLALSGTVESTELEVRYRPQRLFSGYWQGYQSFGSFIQSPPNDPVSQGGDPPDMRSAIDGMLAGPFAKGGARYNVGTLLAPSYVPECYFSAIDCTGYVVIEASDIGNATGQIPTNVANNTAANFAYHPNTFFRGNSDKISGLASRLADDESISATQVGAPIGIYVNSSILSESNWLIVVDGQPQIVRLYADSGLGNPRTPRQIWEQIWAPLLQGSTSAARSVEINRSQKLNGLQYLTYARYLDRPGVVTPQIDIANVG